ncbi:MAG: hypothetical protein JOZ54_16000 [Acidobacteria bacterium]|nr:hypothetical protein [Acidobacteriota bacterium]
MAPSVRVPADYYSAPTSTLRPLFPTWVPFGCGSASLAFLLLLFVGGAWVQRGGMESMMNLVLGTMQTEMEGMYAKDVPDADKKALSEAMASFRANVQADVVPLTQVQTVLKIVQPAIADNSLTRAEVATITEAIRKANVPAAPKAPAKRIPS